MNATKSNSSAHAVSDRLVSIQRVMKEADLDALLCYKVGGEAYAYGGQGYFRYVVPEISPLPIPPAVALVVPEGSAMCVMYRGLTEFGGENDGSLEIRTCEMTDMTRLRSREMLRVVAEAVRERAPRARRVGFVLRDEMPVWIIEGLGAELGTVDIIDSTEDLDRLMMVKDSQGLERVTAVAELADAALDLLLSRVTAGATEVEVVADVKRYAIASGAEYADIRLATNSPSSGAFRVGASSLKPIQRGDHLHIGMDISLDGYWANVVRRGVLGTASSAYRDLYEMVHSMYHQVVRDLSIDTPVGAIAREAAQYARAYFEAIDVSGWEAQRLGHGIGLENQERPFLIEDESFAVAAGMTFAVHPGVLVPGVGQAAVGNIVAVAHDGAYALSRFSDALTELD